MPADPPPELDAPLAPGVPPQPEARLDAFELEQRVLAALSRRAYPEARSMLEALGAADTAAAPVVEELLPPLAALEQGEAAAALFRLLYETTFDSRIEDALHRQAARSLQRDKEDALAARAWATLRGHRGVRKARALLEESGLDEEDVDREVAETEARYYGGRLKVDPQDAIAWERLAASMHTLDRTDEALEAAEKAVALDAGRPVASFVLGECMVALGRTEEAVDWLTSLAEANVGEAWPWLQLAEIHEAHLLDWRAAITCVEQALAHEPGLREANERLRRLLHKAGRWTELVTHIEQMIAQTTRIDELSRLYEELGMLLAARLNSPLEGARAREEAEFYADPAAVAAQAWEEVRADPENADALRAVETLFRVNGMSEDLAEVVHLRLSRVHHVEELLALIDELVMIYAAQVNDPDWDRLVAAIREARERVTDPAALAVLDERVRLVQEVYAARGRTDESELPLEATGGVVYLAFGIGFLVVLALMGGMAMVLGLI